ncbi:helix-turn-helix domain-containing protein [Roseibium aggregatum]|uniref:helix-turn-helix domain-containing protein n=1 Tax=Roseibium aggregatum TaxID=187304 RepID=UPI0025AD7ED7|nr:helix-turn-helix transcriptional regulator [Roseibium aggregatum]WJS05587.1 helix-turn-helix transcriptional regulator [Roseibium aggregatum]
MPSKKETDAVDAHVGQRIRFRRIMLGHSQEALAKALNLTFQQVQKYEKGVNRIGASRLFAIASFLHVPVGFFFEDMPGETQMPEVSEIAPVNIDFMTSKEAVKLCQAFSRIEDQNVRTNLIQMTSAIAGEADHVGVTGHA